LKVRVLDLICLDTASTCVEEKIINDTDYFIRKLVDTKSVQLIKLSVCIPFKIEWFIQVSSYFENVDTIYLRHFFDSTSFPLSENIISRNIGIKCLVIESLHIQYSHGFESVILALDKIPSLEMVNIESLGLTPLVNFPITLDPRFQNQNKNGLFQTNNLKYLYFGFEQAERLFLGLKDITLPSVEILSFRYPYNEEFKGFLERVFPNLLEIKINKF
jgi:hypothetical protein